MEGENAKPVELSAARCVSCGRCQHPSNETDPFEVTVKFRLIPAQEPTGPQSVGGLYINQMKRGIESVAVATYVNWTTSALLANSQDRVRGRIEADKNAYSPNENAKLRLSPGRDQHPRMCALTVSPTEESVRCTVLRHSVTEAVGQPGS